MIIHTSFQLLSAILLIWYGCLRWWWFTYAGKKYPERDYNWANAPINMTTAVTSIVFLSGVLFAFNQTTNAWFEVFKCIAGFLLMRNIWYTIEDVYAYKKQEWNTQKEQAIFVLFDIAMALDTLFWYWFA